MDLTRKRTSGAAALLAALAFAACDDDASTATTTTADGGCTESVGGGAPIDPTRVEPDDELTPLRLLRRASLALLGAPPSDEDLAAVRDLTTPEEGFAYVDAFVDAALTDPRFYDVAFELARKWMNVPLVDRTADAPEYGPKQQRPLVACPDGTPNAGGLFYYRNTEATECASAARTDVEPWWAPGTLVTLVGDAANTTNQGKASENGNLVDITCDGRANGTCGCFTNAASCWFADETYPGNAPFIPGNPKGQRRLLSEEPARLFAHLVWHDRPATDLVLADYSVGPTEVQAAYIQQSLEGGALDVMSDESWWRPSSYAGAPADPRHDPASPEAWREYTVSARNAFFLPERDYTFDPRVDAGTSRGFPSAGALTSLGFLDAYPRERLRAARALEAFACEQLLPPSGDVPFNAYETDPGREGPCQHCHVRIDTAALHFKRYAKNGSAFEGWGARYFMPGVSAWQWDPVWRTGEYPYGNEPFAQWNKWYRPGSLLTPATEEEAAANPYAIFLDFLPPGETLLGQQSDGTVGPLGFAKMIVAAGAFDRCVVRHLHERILGRDVELTTEMGYLDTLTEKFVGDGRKVRPFVKYLTQSTSFRRGR